MSHAIHKTVNPPTGVEVCISANFTGERDVNLIVAKSSLLQIFKLPLQKNDEEPKKTVKLQLVAEYSLFGNIESLKAVRYPRSKTDSLLLSFLDAKISLVEWDQAHHDLKLVSLHFYENDDKLKEGHIRFSSHPRIRVDPLNKCAATIIYDRQLVVLPLRREAIDPTAPLPDGEEAKRLYPSSYVINLRELGIINVLDIQFLNGYHDPTLVILYESELTWTGRTSMKKYTCNLVALSLDLTSPTTHPIIWTVKKLPYDCFAVMPVAEPPGGALVFSPNHVLYFNQSAQYGLSLNHFGDDPAAPFLYEKAKILMTLDTAKFVFLSAEDLLVSDKLGDLYIFHLVFDNRSVQNIEVMKIGASVLASDMCTLANEYLFIGSRLGDSLLIAYSKDLPFEDQPAAGTAEPKEKTDEARPAKRRKTTENGDFVADEEMQENNEAQDNNGTQTNGAAESSDDADEEELMKLMKNSRIIIHDDDTAAGRAKKKTKGKRSRTARYKMAVCDTLPNIGPIADMTVHHSWDPSSLSLLEDPTNHSLFEMVTCSGKNKNGALGVVHQGLRPEVIMSYELPNCVGMWSIKIATAGATDTYHTHLVISKTNETAVFFGEALDDITKTTAFKTSEQTINVGTLANGRYAVQVLRSGLHLVDGSKVVQDVPMNNDHSILQSFICDPMVVVLLDNKTIQVFQHEQGQLKALDVLQPDVNKGNVSAVSLYKDMSFGNIFNQTNTELASPEKDLQSSKTRRAKEDDDIVDDVYNEMVHDMEFLEVYGDLFGTKSSADADHDAFATISKDRILRPTYLVVSRDNGTVEFYRLPKFELVFLCPNLANGSQLLMHHNKSEIHEVTEAEADGDAMEQDVQRTDGGHANSQFNASHGHKAAKFKLPCIVEVALHSFGEDSSPYLLALLDDGDLFVYKGFYYSQHHHAGSKKKKKHTPDDSLPLRFKKVENQMLFRNLKSTFDRAPDDRLVLLAREKLYTSSLLRIHKFDNICGKRGFFLTGARPVFILSERNYLRYHPMVAGGSVDCFTEFHNVNCDRGFIYYNYKQKIHVSSLSQLFSYELPVPHYKMTNKTTVHNIVYQSQRKLDVLVVSERANDQRLYVRKTKLGDEEDTEEGDPSIREQEMKAQMEQDFQTLDPRMPLAFEDRYEVRLVSADTKEVLDKFPLKDDEKEVVLTMKVCYLKNKNSDDDTVEPVKKPILVCGTAYVRGENAVGMGRILLFDIIQVHDDATDQTVFKLKLLYEKEDKGVMSVVASIEGYLLLAIGPKLYMYQLQNMNDLVGVAFFDAQIFITSCQTIKNYIMIGDMYKSIYFLRWKENSRTLTLLAKDVDHFNVESTEFLIDDSQLTMLFADYTSNLHMYQYIPLHKESRGGSRLLPVGNFHLGTRVHKFLRLNLNILKTTQMHQTQKPNYKRSCIMYGGINGTIGYLAPLSEDRFKILGKLEMRLITVINHYAGLNPKAFRLSKPFNKMSHNHLRHVLDGELLWKFTQLEKSKQFEIAQLIGTTPELIVDHLMEIDLSTFFF